MNKIVCREDNTLKILSKRPFFDLSNSLLWLLFINYFDVGLSCKSMRFGFHKVSGLVHMLPK